MFQLGKRRVLWVDATLFETTIANTHSLGEFALEAQLRGSRWPEVTILKIFQKPFTQDCEFAGSPGWFPLSFKGFAYPKVLFQVGKDTLECSITAHRSGNIVHWATCPLTMLIGDWIVNTSSWILRWLIMMVEMVCALISRVMLIMLIIIRIMVINY